MSIQAQNIHPGLPIDPQATPGLVLAWSWSRILELFPTISNLKNTRPKNTRAQGPHNPNQRTRAPPVRTTTKAKNINLSQTSPTC